MFVAVLYSCLIRGVGIVQSVLLLATGWTVWGSNPGGEGEIFCTLQTGPGTHPGSYTGSFEGVNRQRRGIYHPPLSSSKVKEREE